MDPDKLANGLMWYGCPERLSFSISYAYRMLPILMEEFQNILLSYRCLLYTSCFLVRREEESVAFSSFCLPRRSEEFVPFLLLKVPPPFLPYFRESKITWV